LSNTYEIVLDGGAFLAKEYGSRYVSSGKTIGGGAQGDVFLVRDSQDPAGKEYALKRLRKTERLGRFQAEIEALRRITHPNVVPIVDHSGDPKSGDTDHKYWFIMPIASSNLKQRVAIYRDNIDSVLQVGIKLCDALEAAHAVGIVHRDVKPGNILFPRLDHEVWLAYFGICHLAAAKDRLTELGEVLGPRGFTAPELETGEVGNVASSVDLYSLGKVIYYMLSGGQRVAREHLDSQAYLAVFSKGERYGLLRTLLSRLITTVDRRIATAAEVRDGLLRIRDWEQHARSLPLSASALASIEAAQRTSMQRQTILAENARIAHDLKNLTEAVKQGVIAWLDGELAKVASLVQASGTHEVGIAKATWIEDRRFGVDLHSGKTYVGIDGLQFEMVDKSAIFPTRFTLKFFACELRQFSIRMGNQVAPAKAIDPSIALIPYLVEDHDLQSRRHMVHGQVPWSMGGFIRDKIEM
jgi:hypothetical protein